MHVIHTIPQLYVQPSYKDSKEISGSINMGNFLTDYATIIFPLTKFYYFSARIYL